MVIKGKKGQAHKRELREIPQLLPSHQRRGAVPEAHSVVEWARMLFFH